MDRASDDVLGVLFETLLDERSFIWLRTTAPLVCKRWAELLRAPRALFRHVTISPKAECAFVRRAGNLTRVSVDLPGPGGAGPHAASPRTPGSPPGGSSPLLGTSPMPGSSPMRGGWAAAGSSPVGGPSYLLQHYAPHRPHSAAAAAPALGAPSAPTAAAAAAAHPSSSAGPAAGAASTSRCGLHHSASSSRMRARLSSRRVHAWLAPRAAAVESLTLDLTAGAHDISGAALERLMYLLAPSLQRLHLAGSPVDTNDCCEALGVLRSLRHLEITAAAPSVLGSGLMQLAFLPSLRTLVLSLDIPPACPEMLCDLPTALQSLSLGNMWLRELPRQLADLTGLTSISMERCSVEADPLPLLLSLRELRGISIRAPPRPSSRNPLLAGGNGCGGGGGGGGEVERVALVECGLRRVPPEMATLVRLSLLDVSHNPELGADVANCLPEGLAALPALRVLNLSHCGLGQLPPVVGELAHITHLELAGNPLASLPRRQLACAERLAVLGLAGTRLKALPAWLLVAHGLRELAVSAACLAGPPPGGSVASTSRGSAAISTALGALAIGGGGHARASGGDGREGLAGQAAAGWLRQVPEQLPGLRLLRVEGSLWEAAAVRNVIGLLSSPNGGGGLRIELMS